MIKAERMQKTAYIICRKTPFDKPSASTYPIPRLNNPIKKEVYCIEVLISRERAEITVPKEPTNNAEEGAPTK